MYTPTGVFRRFAFIGYHDESQANKATEYYNKTFIDTYKIDVELAKPYGDKEIPRTWSQYSKENKNKDMKRKSSETDTNDTTQDNDNELEKEHTQRLNQTLHKSKLASYLGELYELETDPEFAEFLSLHKSKTSNKAWTNDDHNIPEVTVISKKTKMTMEPGPKQKVKPSIVSVEARRPGGKGILLTRTHLKFEGEEDTEKSKTTPINNQGAECGDYYSNSNNYCVLYFPFTEQISAVSDMEYLKSKIVKIEEENDKASDKKNTESTDEDPMDTTIPSERAYTLKMRGVPFSSKPKAVRAFFYPLKLSDIRMVSDKNGKPTGVVYVDFCSEKDMMDGFKRNRDCMGRRYIELFKDESSLDNQMQIKVKPRPWEDKNMDGVESIGESGRLFIRNLSYSITEDDLTQMFETYGPLSEVLLPLDKTTKKPIGLGFVTFMLPEHAVKASTEMDGKIFHGRLIHILPSKPPVAPSTFLQQTPNNSTSSYKKTKEATLKEQSSSAHNWNSLFLGSNAVVDSMADRYDVEKSDLLDPNTDGSLAVRLALGETQLVTETREFLEEQGVMLDVFEQDKPERNKKVILLKNLAFGTTDQELKELFEPFGTPDRVILPPGGISALVEFSEASKAKKAFKNLAYKEFKHVPLYLEWAPTGVLGKVEQKSSKLLVKNIPFEAGKKEISQLFGTFGKMKHVRLPKKIGSSNEHRGFCFVEFVTKDDAKRAFESLRHSTHLYGRRLVLEWAQLEDSISDIRQKTARYFNDSERSVTKRRKILATELLSSLETSNE